MLEIPLVSVVMITYNHEKYIQQAIEGVLMQKCNFVIELIVADDCSPDTTEVIVNKIKKEHLSGSKISYTKHKLNKGVIPNFNWALNQAKGKYIAICEGDDYWIDPLKLEKQVNFLENNNDFGLISTKIKNYTQLTKKFENPIKTNESYSVYTFKDILLDNKVATLTVLIKKKLIDDYLLLYKEFNGELSGFDYGIWMYCGYHEKIAVLNCVTGVYRILPESASHSHNLKKLWELKLNFYNDFKFYMNYFKNIDKNLIKKAFYIRAKIYFPIACKAEDYNSCEEFKDILKLNSDYLRYFILKKSINNKSYLKFLKYINKLY